MRINFMGIPVSTKIQIYKVRKMGDSLDVRNAKPFVNSWRGGRGGGGGGWDIIYKMKEQVLWIFVWLNYNDIVNQLVNCNAANIPRKRFSDKSKQYTDV